jgi:hypothetical protein
MGPVEMSIVIMLALVVQVLPLLVIIWAAVALVQVRRMQRELLQRVAVLEELFDRRPL